MKRSATLVALASLGLAAKGTASDIAGRHLRVDHAGDAELGLTVPPELLITADEVIE
jgi:hypothetical protein